MTASEVGRPLARLRFKCSILVVLSLVPSLLFLSLFMVEAVISRTFRGASPDLLVPALCTLYVLLFLSGVAPKIAYMVARRGGSALQPAPTAVWVVVWALGVWLYVAKVRGWMIFART
jgi:hypothetical protein